MVLLMGGVHVPVMPLFEVVGNAGMVAPAQYPCTIPEKVGVKSGFIVIVIVVGVVVTHCPAVGVNV